MSDPVHNPSHYKSGGIEVIDVIEAFDLNFRLANVIKYVLRAGRKGDALEDLEKAAWYLDREIDKLEEKAEAEEVATDAAHTKPVVCAEKPESEHLYVDVTSRESTAREMRRVFPDTPLSQSGGADDAIGDVVAGDKQEYDG